MPEKKNCLKIGFKSTENFAHSPILEIMLTHLKKSWKYLAFILHVPHHWNFAYIPEKKLYNIGFKSVNSWISLFVNIKQTPKLGEVERLLTCTSFNILSVHCSKHHWQSGR